MSTKILRPKDIYGPGNPLPVGHSKFWRDFVYKPGGDEFIPGTKIKRLRLVQLGDRAVGAFSDEVEELIEAYRALRNRVPAQLLGPQHANQAKRERAVAAKRAGATGNKSVSTS
jgi:hypothetical protein